MDYSICGQSMDSILNTSSVGLHNNDNDLDYFSSGDMTTEKRSSGQFGGNGPGKKSNCF